MIPRSIPKTILIPEQIPNLESIPDPIPESVPEPSLESAPDSTSESAPDSTPESAPESTAESESAPDLITITESESSRSDSELPPLLWKKSFNVIGAYMVMVESSARHALLGFKRNRTTN